jgi:hypothetical protein
MVKVKLQIKRLTDNVNSRELFRVEWLKRLYMVKYVDWKILSVYDEFMMLRS